MEKQTVDLKRRGFKDKVLLLVKQQQGILAIHKINTAAVHASTNNVYQTWLGDHPKAEKETQYPWTVQFLASMKRLVNKAAI